MMHRWTPADLEVLRRLGPVAAARMLNVSLRAATMAAHRHKIAAPLSARSGSVISDPRVVLADGSAVRCVVCGRRFEPQVLARSRLAPLPCSILPPALIAHGDDEMFDPHK